MDVRDFYVVGYRRYGGNLNRHKQEIDISRQGQEDSLGKCFGRRPVVMVHTPRFVHVFVAQESTEPAAFQSQIQRIAGVREKIDASWPDIFLERDLPENWIEKTVTRASAELLAYLYNQSQKLGGSRQALYQ